MSTENASLADYLTPDTDTDTNGGTPEDDGTSTQTASQRPNWTPKTNNTQDTCQNCNAPVDSQTARVWGDNTDTLHHCPECVTMTALKAGAGAVEDYERRCQNTGHLGGGL